MLRELLNREEKIRCATTVVLTLLGACLDILFVGIIPGIVAAIAEPSQLAAVPILGSKLQGLGSQSELTIVKVGAVALVLVGLIRLAFALFMHTHTLKTGRNIRVRMAGSLLNAYLCAPWSFHARATRAELTRNLVADTREVVSGIIYPLASTVEASIMAVVFLILMFSSLPLGIVLIFGLTGLVAFGGLSLVSKKLGQHGHNAKLQNKGMIKDVQESLSQVVEIQIAKVQAWFVDRFQEKVISFSRSNERNLQVSRTLPHAMELMSVFTVMLIIYLLARSTNDISSILPQVSLIGIVAVRLRQTSSKIAGSAAQIQFSTPALEHLYHDLTQLKPQAQPSLVPIEKRNPFENLKLSAVCFQYPEAEAPALRGINLEITAGQSVAFTGETGCGKSTLLRILLGLFPPGSGSITVNEADLHQHLPAWHDKIGYVPQSIQLLDSSIRENIAFGIETNEIEEDRLQVAVKAAVLSSVVEGLPEGLDAPTGENGNKLSGGQQQRIGIARAIYRRPEVFILDEATSALDHETEIAVLKALRNLPWKPTILMVTHRVKAVEAFDRVVRLEAGSIKNERHSSPQITDPENDSLKST